MARPTFFAAPLEYFLFFAFFAIALILAVSGASKSELSVRPKVHFLCELKRGSRSWDFYLKQSGLRGFEVDDEQPDPQRTEIVKAVIVLKSGLGTDGSHSWWYASILYAFARELRRRRVARSSVPFCAVGRKLQ